MLAACYGLVHDNSIKCPVHVTGVNTWGLYTKCTICMLGQMHDLHVTGVSTICTIAGYGIGTIIFLIATVTLEYHIIVLIARDFVFRHRSFLYGFRFFSFLLSYLQLEFLSVSTYLLSLWVSKFAVLCNCRSKLRPSTWTSTRTFDWDPHICRGGHVFTTAKFIQNNVLYHTVI